MKKAYLVFLTLLCAFSLVFAHAEETSCQHEYRFVSAKLPVPAYYLQCAICNTQDAQYTIPAQADWIDPRLVSPTGCEHGALVIDALVRIEIMLAGDETSDESCFRYHYQCVCRDCGEAVLTAFADEPFNIKPKMDENMGYGNPEDYCLHLVFCEEFSRIGYVYLPCGLTDGEDCVFFPDVLPLN